MFAELDYECVEKDEQKCGACRERFRCWTTRSLSLPILHLSMSKSIDMRDEFEFVAELPNCFKGGNMVGSKVKIHAEHDNVMHLLNGIVTEETIRAEDDKQMKITLKGVGEIF